MQTGKCGKRVLVARQGVRPAARTSQTIAMRQNEPNCSHVGLLLVPFCLFLFRGFLSGKMKRNSFSPLLSFFLSFLFFFLSLFSHTTILWATKLPAPKTRHPGHSSVCHRAWGRERMCTHLIEQPKLVNQVCSSHPDDFLFKIHLRGSCVTFIFHSGLLTHSAFITTGHLEDFEPCWLWGWGKGRYFLVMVHQL